MSGLSVIAPFGTHRADLIDSGVRVVNTGRLVLAIAASLWLFPDILLAQSNKSDCIGAIVLCDDIYSESQASFTYGNIYEYTGGCNANLEVSSVWYTWTVQSPGNLSFILTPNTPSADYDWGLFNITNSGCNGIGNGTSPQVSCNSWGTGGTNGPTGISSANGGYGNSGGPGSGNGPPFNADLPVQAGQTYALVVMNWSNSSSGYTINFGASTANLFDGVPPSIVSVTPNCTNTVFTVQMSEPILGTSLQLSDFSLQGNGVTIPFTSAQFQVPGAADDVIILQSNTPVTTSGFYTFSITGNSGFVEDGCGNLGQGSVSIELFGPLLDVSPPQTICQYQSVQLSATPDPYPSVSYSWNPVSYLDNPGISDPLATPFETTTYTVQATTPNGCSAQGSVTLTVLGGEITLFDLSPDQGAICAGENVPLEVTAEKRIWSDDFDPQISAADWSSINGGISSAACGSLAGNGLYFSGVAPREAVTIPLDMSAGGTVHFSLKVANGVSPCDDAEPGDDIALSYSVNNGPFTDIQVFSESAYPVMTGLSAVIPPEAWSGNVRFRWSQTGVYGVGQDHWVLDNVYISADLSDELIYSWSPSAGLSDQQSFNPIASPVQSTMYVVELNDGNTGCTLRDSIFIAVGEPFTLEMHPDTILCDPGGMELFAVPDRPGNFTYLWSPSGGLSDATDPAPYVDPQSTTLYSVVVLSDDYCAAEGETNVIVGLLPELLVTADDEAICEGQSVQLHADLPGDPSGVSYQWTPPSGLAGSQFPNATATPEEDITYLCTVTHVESGCQKSDELFIHVSPEYTVFVNPSDTAVCVVAGLPLSATAGTSEDVTWSWTPSALVAQSNQPETTLITSESAVLIITAVNETGCQAAATVNVQRLTETTDLGPDVAVCEDQPVILNAQWPSYYSIQWSSGQTTPVITVTESGVYAVEVTSPLGCFSADEVQVEIFTFPVVDLGADTAFCFPESVVLTGGEPTLNYNWSTGEITPEITVNETGTYTVTATNGYCYTTDEINVTVNPLPGDVLPEKAHLCTSFPPYLVELDAGNPGSTYQWSDGSTAQTTQLFTQGDVWVRVTSPRGCVSTFTTRIEEICPGALYVPNSFTPDQDGINDAWQAKGENVAEFQVWIYNRWGELVFESDRVDSFWQGEKDSGGHYAPDGVYLYVIRYRIFDEDGELSERVEKRGQVTLIR